MNPNKVQAIRELAAPTNLMELRRTLGMINYLGRFLLELSTVMKPMTDLLKSTSLWLWGRSSARTIILQGERHVDIDASFSLL